MAYKDEYEVARLFTDGAFARRLAETFSGAYRVEYHLAPPLLARLDPSTGRPSKMTLGPWTRFAFKLLSSLRGVRGSLLDPFGYTLERRQERAAVDAYEARIGSLLGDLNLGNVAVADAIARLPLRIKGYGPVKAETARRAELELTHLEARWEASRPVSAHARVPEAAHIDA